MIPRETIRSANSKSAFETGGPGPKDELNESFPRVYPKVPVWFCGVKFGLIGVRTSRSLHGLFVRMLPVARDGMLRQDVQGNPE